MLERYFDIVISNSSFTIVLVLAEEPEINRLLITSRVGSIAQNRP